MDISRIDEKKSTRFLITRMDNCPSWNMPVPKLEAVIQNYQGQIKVLKINVENDSPMFDNNDIEMVPTLLFFNNGE